MPEPQFDINAIAEEAKNLMPVEVADPGNDPAAITPEVDSGVEQGAEPIPTEPSAVSPQEHTLTQEQWDTWNAYQQLDQRLRQDQEFAARFRQAFDPPAPVTPPPPDPSDRYVDPDVKALRDEIAQIRESQRMIQSSTFEQQQIENKALIARTRESFKTAHGLDDTQMNKVAEEANRYAGMLQTYTGVDRESALTQVFSAAYWNMPEMQQLELERRIKQADEDKTRKAKASSLSSGSGSAPRTSEGPKTEQQRRDAMTRDLAEVFTGATN